MIIITIQAGARQRADIIQTSIQQTRPYATVQGETAVHQSVMMVLLLVSLQELYIQYTPGGPEHPTAGQAHSEAFGQERLP